MNEVKRLYETTFIINASLEDPQIEVVTARIQETISKSGDEIVAINRWGRKRLTYPVKKKNNGYYVNIEFNGRGSTVKQLEHVYHLEENILRFLTIRLEKNALQAREMRPALTQEAPPEIELPFTKGPLFDDETAEA